MVKGQAFQKNSFTGFGFLILSFFLSLLFSGCSPAKPSKNHTPSASLVTSAYTDSAQTPDPANYLTPDITSKTPPLDCLSYGGSVEDGSFYSDYLAEDFFYKIYLPPCYDADEDQNYPVLYLLHGLSYDHQQWLRLGLVDQMDAMIKSGQISPFFVVMPLEARFDPPETSSFSEALIEELIPDIDQNFRTVSEKNYRWIGGLSRGAAWSLRLGFEHYELFSKVGAHSLPIFKSDVNRIQTWLREIPKQNLPVFFIDIGRNDPERQTAQNFAQQLDHNAAAHEWYLFNGGHEESYWADHLEQYLLWYASDW